MNTPTLTPKPGDPVAVYSGNPGRGVWYDGIYEHPLANGGHSVLIGPQEHLLTSLERIQPKAQEFGPCPLCDAPLVSECEYVTARGYVVRLVCPSGDYQRVI